MVDPNIFVDSGRIIDHNAGTEDVGGLKTDETVESYNNEPETAF